METFIPFQLNIATAKHDLAATETYGPFAFALDMMLRLCERFKVCGRGTRFTRSTVDRVSWRLKDEQSLVLYRGTGLSQEQIEEYEDMALLET